MTNHGNDTLNDNEETLQHNESESIREVDENDVPGTRSQNKDLQYGLATERNRLRWEYLERYEKAAIEREINEDIAVKQRRSISQAVKMSEIILNVQEALHSGIEHDVPKAIENLDKLMKEPFTTMSLLYAPCVVKTVYLCCTYEKSDEIRALAEKCYRRFEPCFGVPEGETFETAFQTEVREFWEKQNTIVYDLAKYDWKQFTMDDDSCIETENSEEMEGELKPTKSETKVDIQAIKVKSETDDKSIIKKEIKKELLDDKNLIKKEISLKTENSDDKSLVKKEATKVKVECKTENSQFDSTIKEEEMDTDDIEITYCKVLQSENDAVLPKLSVKLETVDLEKLNAKYDSDKDCFILN